MKFSKMHGLGNDFVVIEKLTQNVFLDTNFIKKLSDRNTGIGFDQLLIIEPPYDPDCDFHYRIFNADGSEVSQCGNGARCIALFLKIKRLTNKNKLLLSTNSSKVAIEHQGKNIKVNMGSPIFEPSLIPFVSEQESLQYSINLQNQQINFGAVSMGNPHCVIVVDNFYDMKKLNIIGKTISEHPVFPKQVNVGFMQILDRNHINLRVYERGVGFTKACGSGACAAVAVGVVNNFLDNQVKVTMQGGDLEINFTNQQIFMTGQATHVFDGYLKI